MPLRAHVQFTPFDASSGAALTSATVNVFQPGTVTPVAGTLFDKSGGTLANPLTSDATTGLVDFYMNVAQEVDLQVAKSGFTTRTYSNVPVLDDAGNDLTALLTATGQMIYASAANTPAALAIGATGTFLTNTGASTPGWSNTISAGGLTVTAGGLTVTAGQTVFGSAANAAAGVTCLTVGSGTVQSAVLAQPTGTSTATVSIDGVESQAGTAAAAFTCTTVADYHAYNPLKGAGSTITNAYGLLVDAITVGGTQNFAGYFNIASGATANGSIAAFGDVLIGGAVASTIATTATTGFVYLPYSVGAPTGVPAMLSAGPYVGHVPFQWDSTNNKLWIYSAGWKGVVLA